MVSPVDIEIFLERVRTLWDRGEMGTGIDILWRPHLADSSGFLYLIPPESQKTILQELRWEEAAEVLEELGEGEMVDREALTARVDADQEEVPRILSRYNLLSVFPAVNIARRIGISSLPR